MKMNDWNNNLQVREQMQNDALEYKLRETNPEQAKRDIASRMSVRMALLILALVVIFLLVRGM